MSVPVIDGLAAIAERFDAFLLDQWGVVHDGTRPFPGVADALERLRAAGKRVLLLSNAPRRAAESITRLTGMGLPPGLVEAAVTSGEAVHQALAARDDPAFAALGTRYLHLGRADGTDDVLAGLPLARVEDVADAEFLVVANLPSRSDTLAVYDPVLDAGARRGLPMVCANPDRFVVHAGRTEPCAGSVAERYRVRGGAVLYRGKPFREVYDLALARLDGIRRARVLMVGDGLETDILGARNAGLPALLITGGLLAGRWGRAPTARPDAARIAEACAEVGVTPDWATATLTW
jgi:HAD superfamily hydrolase (TIGR01459 family)